MYSTIGKAVLYQAIGLKDNTKQIKLIDNKSKCANCPWLQAALSPYATDKTYETLKSKCATCSCKKAYEVKYVNEKNQYGSDKAKLNRSSLLLFIKLHSYCPTNAGFIENINVETLASSLNVNVRTIRNSLKTLVDSNYIYCEGIYSNHINVILLDYKNYFLKANENGRGYIKLQNTTISDLCKIKSVLVVRLMIRELLLNKESDIKSYRELHTSLPAYCKRNVIINKLQQCAQNIFSITFSDLHVEFSILDKLNTNVHLNAEYEKYSTYYSSIFEEVNNIVFENKELSPNNIPEHLKKFFVNADGSVVKEPVMYLHIEEHSLDLARLTCKYSKQVVTTALADAYRVGMCKTKKLIKHLGAYVHEIIKGYGIKESTLFDNENNTTLLSSLTNA